MGIVYEPSAYEIDIHILVFINFKCPGGPGAIWISLGLLSFNQSHNRAKQM